MKIYDVRGIGASLTGSFSGSFKGLFTGPLDGVAATSSYVEYTNVANKPALVSGSSQVLGFNVFATTGSNGFNGNQSITGSLTVTGQVIAQTLNVQQVTSSIVFSSGSNRFGNNTGNTHSFTGSVRVTGSLTTSIATLGTAATTFLTSDSGTIKSRTAAQTLSDIGGQATGSYVTVATNQSITGQKTFTKNIDVNGVYVGRGASSGDLFGGISGNTAIGSQALLSISTGYPNTAVGAEALRNITTGANNIAVGSTAGKLISAGTANETSTTSIYIGNDTRPSANGNTNEIVIGHTTTGNGSNTVTIGNSSITNTYLKGALTLTGALNGTSATFTSTGNAVTITTNSSASNVQLKVNNGSSGDIYAGVAASDGSSVFTGTTAYSGYIGTNQAVPFYIVAGGVARVTISSTGAATFSSTVQSVGVLSAGNSGATTGQFIIESGANAASRRWKLLTSQNVNGDFVIQQSTTQTGATFADILGFNATGAATFSGNLSVFSSTYDNNAEGIKLGYDPNYYNAIKAVFTSAASSNKMTFVVNNGIGTRGDVMTLVGNGNVGIGTTSPGYRLVVEGSEAIVSIVDNRSFSTGVGGALYLLGNYRSVGDVTVAGYIKGSKVNSTEGDYGFNLIFANQTYTGGVSEKMRITSTGNVIIGNTTAYGGLTISDFTSNDGNDSLAFFYRGTTGNHESLIKFYDFRGQVNAAIGNSLEDDGSGTQKARLVFKTSYSGAPTERMRITSGGNVLIGTTDDNGAKLQVNGIKPLSLSGGGATKQHLINSKTAASSGTALKLFYVGFSHAVRLYLYILQDSNNIATATADFTTTYGASSGGITQSSRIGNISSISANYNNGGSPAYTIDVTVNYTGAAPTIYAAIEGISNDAMYKVD